MEGSAVKPTYEELEQRIRKLEARLGDRPGTAERLLDRLAETWEREGPPGFMEVAALLCGLDESTESAREILNGLVAKGWITVDESGFSAHLTPAGYAQARPRP
jgi:Mn-dependent DtxR family transcriptional regulator